MHKKKHKSEAFASIHETMSALHEIGAVEKATMREFDEASLAKATPRNGDFPCQHS